MDPEESRLLVFARDRVNAEILAGKEPDFDGAFATALDDLSVIGEEHMAALAKSINVRVKGRAAHAASVRRRLEERWGKALAAFDECIATAEEINSILVSNIACGVPGEAPGGSSVRRYGRDLMIGGGQLKLLLLGSLQARACTTATEISLLLGAGLPQAAESRTRSLYEQNVITFILVNDKTYEICERYHDSAVIESMQYFRSHNMYAEQLGWKPIKDDHLKNAEEFADLAVKNWGRRSEPSMVGLHR